MTSAPLARIAPMLPPARVTRFEYESLAQASARTGVSQRTLRRRIADGQLPAYRVGSRLLRLMPDDVDALLRPVPNGSRR